MNNILVGAPISVPNWSNFASTTVSNVLIANNTVVDTTSCGIQVAKPLHPNTTVINNISYQSKSGTFCTRFTDLTIGNNDWFGPAPQQTGSGDITSDPELVNPGGLRPADNKLLAGSPCIDTGQATANVTTDFFGTSRPQGKGYDIGAYELPVAPASGGSGGASDAGASAGSGGTSDAGASAGSSGTSSGSGGATSADAGSDASERAKSNASSGCGCRTAPEQRLPVWPIVLALAADLAFERRRANR